MKLKDKKNRIIKLNNREKIDNYILELKKWHKLNPTKDLETITKSLIPAEIFSSLWTEGEISSRRQIKKTFTNNSRLNNNVSLMEKKFKDFINAFVTVTDAKEFSVSAFFNLYSTISKNGIEIEDKIEDGHMFRHEDVYISDGRAISKENYSGFNPKDILIALKNLSSYLNDDNDDLYLKAIIGHIYFEMIHPYFDFNGRTGRFIPLWLFTNNKRPSEMMYFATAIGNYKKQYLALFNKYIDKRTYEVKMDEMIIGMLKLLILNQKQYFWIKKIENEFLDKNNKSFSPIQKDFIWLLMIKSEISNQNNSWFKLTNDDKHFVEFELKSSLFTNETKALEKGSIILISSDRPRKYKLKNYKILAEK